MNITTEMAVSFAKFTGATLDRATGALTFTPEQFLRYTRAIEGAVLLDEPEAHDDTETTTH